MKIYNYQLDGWLKNHSLHELNFVLVFGPDEGAIESTGELVAKNWLSSGDYEVIKKDFKEIKDDFSTCLSELNSVSLFGQRNLLVITNSGASLNKEILSTLERSGYGGKILFKGNDLKASSSFRKFAENSPKGLSIGCYKEDSKQIALFIRQFFQEQKVDAAGGVVELLSTVLPPNKILIRSELEKLITYCLGRQINAEDIGDVVCGGQELALDELCVAMIAGNKQAIVNLMRKAEQQDENFMLIIRVLQRYVMRILTAKSQMQQGMDATSAVAKLTPPVFFKQRDELIRVCNTANVQNILALNTDLVKLERDCKFAPLDHYSMITNFLIQR
jgi:DNA polymerase-3 subunit delta